MAKGTGRYADGRGVQWLRGYPSFESDRIARRERNAGHRHDDAARMRAIHAADYARQEGGNGCEVDVHAKAAEHRAHHKAQYDRLERRQGHTESPHSNGRAHLGHSGDYRRNDGSARHENSNRYQSDNKLKVPKSWTVHGKTFNFKNNYALIGDGGPRQGTSHIGTYRELPRLGDGKAAIIKRGQRHILVIGGNSSSGGDRSRAAVYITRQAALDLKEKGVRFVVSRNAGSAPRL